MSSRCDSLADELRRRNAFEDYFDWCASARPTPPAKLRHLKRLGIETSISSIRRLHRGPEAFSWRHQEGLKARAARDKITPKEIRGAMREAILDQAYDEVVGDLTHREIMDHMICQHEEAKLDFQRKKLAIQTRLKRRDQSLQLRKLKTRIEAALDALSEEIGSNERAQKHFDAMRDALKEARA
jgi:hypothetical protein